MALNINREVEDTFYRYKMPKLTAKVEGKGNGIKTVIVNVSDIAKALYRKPIYVTKYFGCELGAQIHVDEKNERYIVNGAHDAGKLQEILDGFIKKFVLCQGCGNPETTMHVSKKSATVATTCKACGAQGQLDVAHRLTQYIVKNPPDPDAVSAGVKSKKGKKGKTVEKTSDDNPSVANGGDDDAQHSPMCNADDDDDWIEDTTEEAQLQRMNELSVMARSLALSVCTEKSETERANIFYTHMVQLRDQGEVISSRRDLRKEADDLSLGPRAVLVLAEALLTSPDNIITDIEKYASVFVLFTRTGDSQTRAQQYALGAMSKLIERYAEQNLLAKACHILKQLYDSDIIEEETILTWADRGPSKKMVSQELSAKILNMCTPMVKWLREAEEEESDDESESETDAPSVCPNNSTNGVVNELLSTTEVVSDEEELDIDAI